MIDLEKEEFLQRLDVRLVAISSMLACHEKYISSALCDPQAYKKSNKIIDDTTERFREYIFDTDKKIQEQFEQIKKELGASDNDRQS